MRDEQEQSPQDVCGEAIQRTVYRELTVSTAWYSMTCYQRHKGNLLPGSGKLFAQKILASCPNFYETVEKKRGQTMQQRRPYWHMKVARYCNSFSGSIPSNFEHNYVAIDKHLEKLLP